MKCVSKPFPIVHYVQHVAFLCLLTGSVLRLYPRTAVEVASAPVPTASWLKKAEVSSLDHWFAKVDNDD